MRIILLLFTMLTGPIGFAQTPSPPAAVTASLAYSQGVGVTQVSRAGAYSVVSSVTNMAPSAGTFTCSASTSVCTLAAHGYLTGLVVRASTSSALPTGLATSTDYFIIPISANTFYFASSLVNAQAGTFITISSTGTGTQTVTPTALAGASLKLQGSMDNSTWIDLPIKATGDATKSASITTTASFYLGDAPLNINYVRVYYTLTTGQLSVSNISKVIKTATAPY